MSTTLGIFQGDLIIRSAINKAFEDMRQNPWLLDYVMLGLASDSLTVKEFGIKQIHEARNWFLKTNINVYHGLGISEPNFPCVTINLQDSRETEKTLGDVHYTPKEKFENSDTSLTNPFQPTLVSRDLTAGTSLLEIPEEVATGIYLFPGMIVKDSVGGSWVIQSTPNYNQIVIKNDNQELRLNSMTIHLGGDAPWLVNLESVQMSETYVLGLHVQGPPLYLIVLYSVMVFVLERYKQSLIEARGFNETSFSVSDFNRNNQMSMESTFSRYITITGTVRQYWPKDVNPSIQGVVLNSVRAHGANRPATDNTLGNLMWIGETDEL